MKKLSVSVFAVLAIVIAIGSAFTTKSTTEETKYRAFAPFALKSTSLGTIASSTVLDDNVWDLDPITQTELENMAKAEFSETSIANICDGNDDYYCVATVKAQVDGQSVVSYTEVTTFFEGESNL